MTQVQEMLEQIVQDTVNADTGLHPVDELEEFSKVPADEFLKHAQFYVDRWLDCYVAEGKPVNFDSLVALYMSGFISGRHYEERRHETNEIVLP